jgi:hypothetical protein
MDQIFKRHLDFALAGCAAFLIIGILGYFAWGITAMFTGLERGLAAQSGVSEEANVNTDGAEKILAARGISK